MKEFTYVIKDPVGLACQTCRTAGKEGGRVYQQDYDRVWREKR